MIETWKDIENYEGSYQVSNLGRIKSFMKKEPQILKEATSIEGYKFITLTKNLKHKSLGIHRLIAIHFIPNPNSKPEINHINCNPSDNRIENLEWCTPKENKQHSVRMGRVPNGVTHYLSKLNEEQVVEIRGLYANGNITMKEIAKKYNVSNCAIRYVIRRITWKHLN